MYSPSPTVSFIVECTDSVGRLIAQIALSFPPRWQHAGTRGQHCEMLRSGRCCLVHSFVGDVPQAVTALDVLCAVLLYLSLSRRRIPRPLGLRFLEPVCVENCSKHTVGDFLSPYSKNVYNFLLRKLPCAPYLVRHFLDSHSVVQPQSCHDRCSLHLCFSLRCWIVKLKDPFPLPSCGDCTRSSSPC